MALLFPSHQLFSEQSCIELEPGNGPVTLGRNPKNMICLTHQSVSRQHCEFVKFEGRWYVVDVGSKHGTGLKHPHERHWRWLRAHDKVPLENGCKLLFGGEYGAQAGWVDNCQETAMPPDFFKHGWPGLFNQPERKIEALTDSELPEIDNAWELIPWFARWVESHFGKVGLFAFIVVAIAILVFIIA